MSTDVKLPTPKTYSEYVEAMKALPVHQQWVMFISANLEREINGKKECVMIEHGSPLEDMSGNDVYQLVMRRNGEMTVWVLCNDSFYRACADGEDIEIYDIPMLVQLDRRFGYKGVTEWIARKRNMRPLTKVETGITESQWQEFQADFEEMFKNLTCFFPWWSHKDDDNEGEGR